MASLSENEGLRVLEECTCVAVPIGTTKPHSGVGRCDTKRIQVMEEFAAIAQTVAKREPAEENLRRDPPTIAN